MKKETPYNPLDKINLGESVADALLTKTKALMDTVELFCGAGIYAIYYNGDFSPYTLISGKEIPIYVGKAVPREREKETSDWMRIPVWHYSNG